MSFREFVEDYPISAVCFAFAAGMLIFVFLALMFPVDSEVCAVPVVQDCPEVEQRKPCDIDTLNDCVRIDRNLQKLASCIDNKYCERLQ